MEYFLSSKHKIYLYTLYLNDYGWRKLHDFYPVTGRKIVPDPEFYRFDERREFCKNYDGYPEFCDRKS